MRQCVLWLGYGTSVLLALCYLSWAGRFSIGIPGVVFLGTEHGLLVLCTRTDVIAAKHWWYVSWDDQGLLHWWPNLAPQTGFFFLPIWMPLTLVLAGTLLFHSRSRHRLPPNHCPCGYDLAHNESGICPECGQEVPT